MLPAVKRNPLHPAPEPKSASTRFAEHLVGRFWTIIGVENFRMSSADSVLWRCHQVPCGPGRLRQNSSETKATAGQGSHSSEEQSLVCAVVKISCSVSSTSFSVIDHKC